MNKYFLFILYFITSIVSTSSIAVTNISVNQFCNTNDKLIHFDKYSYDTDLTVNFSRYSIDPDLTVKVEDYEFLADIVIKDNQDNQDNQDYSVCKSRDGLTVKISEYSYDSDITIEISEYSYDPDIRIFHNSSIISLEEAISFLVLSNLLVEN
ncbi:MAG: hypothetical protein HOB81_01850 [Flavobacteriaceae bacterium]|jgi:hypothetical protein|nr:hypothetical protein [Flavobacteriaceae bacterium]